MSKAKTRRGRKHRRSFKAILQFGPNAKRRHRRRSGRSGSIHDKQIAGARTEGTASNANIQKELLQ